MMVLTARLTLVVIALGLFGCSKPKGTCVTEKANTCMVNFSEAACTSPGLFKPASGEAGVAACKAEGYTDTIKPTGGKMTDTEVKAALEKGDIVTFEKPLAAK